MHMNFIQLYSNQIFVFRFMKYATKEKKEGRVPFIDPYKMNPCRQVYGETNFESLKNLHLFRNINLEFLDILYLITVCMRL